MMTQQGPFIFQIYFLFLSFYPFVLEFHKGDEMVIHEIISAIFFEWLCVIHYNFWVQSGARSAGVL
jgi:hypothetical protein